MLSALQQRVLFVYDPLALHHIVVKDHETIYDEPYWFVGYVQHLLNRGIADGEAD